MYFLLALGVDDQVHLKKKNIKCRFSKYASFVHLRSIQKLSKYLVMCLNKFLTRPHTEKNEDIWKNSCTTGKYDKYGRISFEIKKTVQ